MQLEINTQQLDRDIRLLQERNENLKSAQEKVFQCMEKINAMWEGPAHSQFIAQVASDSVILAELVENIGNLTECMTYAKNEYEKCSDAVKDKIAALRMSNDT